MRQSKVELENATVRLRELDNWLDLIRSAEHVLKHAHRDHFNGFRCSSLNRLNESWTGTYSLGHAIDLAYLGWPEGRQMLKALREKLEIKRFLPTGRGVIITHDVYGDEPDVERFLSGEPENMTTLRDVKQRRTGKLVRIAVNNTAPHTIPADQITRRGLAILLALETVALLGYSTEIMLASSSQANSGTSSYYEIHIPVLHAGDPINLDSFAFMFMHPSVLRRLIFALKETEEADTRRMYGFHRDGGYGTCSEPQLLPEHDLVLGWREGLMKNNEEVIPFTRSILERVGIDTSRA